MNPEKWERIARALKAQHTGNKQIAEQLGVCISSVRLVRTNLGMESFRHRRKVWTREEFERAAPRIHGGHRIWKGRTGPSGTPMANRTLTAYQLAFSLHHGRRPVGKVTGTCRKKGCVEGAHLVDTVLREAANDPAALTELPPGATWRGMDLVAIRRCLRGPAPWPVLSLDEKRLAFRFSDPDMSAAQLARRLGMCSTTIERYRKNGVPS
ncbi:hypothetical protein [Streptomyces parvulus]|uniref:hypothetical protein n=1 Tax=Streptomyces parvulus TaxID=146923 RepID=UPI00382A4611